MTYFFLLEHLSLMSKQENGTHVQLTVWVLFSYSSFPCFVLSLCLKKQLLSIPKLYLLNWWWLACSFWLVPYFWCFSICLMMSSNKRPSVFYCIYCTVYMFLLILLIIRFFHPDATWLLNVEKLVSWFADWSKFNTIHIPANYIPEALGTCGKWVEAFTVGSECKSETQRKLRVCNKCRFFLFKQKTGLYSFYELCRKPGAEHSEVRTVFLFLSQLTHFSSVSGWLFFHQTPSVSHSVRLCGIHAWRQTQNKKLLLGHFLHDSNICTGMSLQFHCGMFWMLLA